MSISSPAADRTHRFGIGARVKLAKPIMSYPAGSAGTVAEQLLGIGGKPRYGVRLHCNKGLVTTDVSEHEIEASR